MGKSFKMAWRNMWRNWRRTAIALSAIVLGLILLLFLNGVIQGSDQASTATPCVSMAATSRCTHKATASRPTVCRCCRWPMPTPPLLPPRRSPRLWRLPSVSPPAASSVPASSFPVRITAIQPSVEAPLSMQAENIAAGRYLLDEDGDAVLIGQGPPTSWASRLATA